jgi:hypothetical protein
MKNCKKPPFLEGGFERGETKASERSENVLLSGFVLPGESA